MTDDLEGRIRRNLDKQARTVGSHLEYDDVILRKTNPVHQQRRWIIPATIAAAVIALAIASTLIIRGSSAPTPDVASSQLQLTADSALSPLEPITQPETSVNSTSNPSSASSRVRTPQTSTAPAGRNDYGCGATPLSLEEIGLNAGNIDADGHFYLKNSSSASVTIATTFLAVVRNGRIVSTTRAADLGPTSATQIIPANQQSEFTAVVGANQMLKCRADDKGDFPITLSPTTAYGAGTYEIAAVVSVATSASTFITYVSRPVKVTF